MWSLLKRKIWGEMEGWSFLACRDVNSDLSPMCEHLTMPVLTLTIHALLVHPTELVLRAHAVLHKSIFLGRIMTHYLQPSLVSTPDSSTFAVSAILPWLTLNLSSQSPLVCFYSPWLTLVVVRYFLWYVVLPVGNLIAPHPQPSWLLYALFGKRSQEKMPW